MLFPISWLKGSKLDLSQSCKSPVNQFKVCVPQTRGDAVENSVRTGDMTQLVYTQELPLKPG